MADITDLGLPVGLPEMLKDWAPNQYTIPNPLYAAPPREMTAADLGLRGGDRYSFGNAQMNLWHDHLWLNRRKPDAPYSFWLGADHG